MPISAKPTHVVVAEQTAEAELMRRRQLKALDELIPWKDKDHPELNQGAASYVRKLRREYEKRFKKMSAR